MPICPRCRKEVDVRLFQPPVSICMVCYATTQGNAGLSLLQLKEKAVRSYRANRRRNLERRRDLLEGFMPFKDVTPTGISITSQDAVKTDSKEVIKRDLEREVEWFNCAMCGDDVSDADIGARTAFRMTDSSGNEIIKCYRCINKYIPFKKQSD